MKVVAKKTLNKASTENLLTEIEILKSIRHPHIVQLQDFQVTTQLLLVLPGSGPVSAALDPGRQPWTQVGNPGLGLAALDPGRQPCSWFVLFLRV